MVLSKIVITTIVWKTNLSFCLLQFKSHCCLSEGRGCKKLLANSFRILVIVGDWRSLSALLEAVRPVVEVASKAELELFAPLVSARVASRALGVSHSLGRHL